MPEKNNFDSVSPYYDRLVRLVFGRSMMHAQSFFLNRIPTGSSVLVLGGGTGLWLNELLKADPGCKIVYIDSSAKMIDRAKKITNNSTRIDFRLGNEGSIYAVDHFYVVVVYCYLDLFTDNLLREVITKIRNATTKESRWIVVDFVSTSWWHKVMLFIMYNFFRITTGLVNHKLPEWEQTLKENHLHQVEEKLFYHGFIKSAVFIGNDV
jgi:tRNA (cmo5U34)-methyltransferase